MSGFSYVGSELDLFAGVGNWKSYWSSKIRPFIAGDVLEVGAGFGANTPYLYTPESRRWVCVEPDPQLVTRLRANIQQLNFRDNCEVVWGTVQALETRQFDTIIYIDVLEHIEGDVAEIKSAATLLRPGGHLIVLSPAHQFLFSAFDAAIGHYRRYNRQTLSSVTPASMDITKIWYLDSAGFVLSLANRLLLKQSMPTREQLRFWDRSVIPVSRFLDRCLFYSVGKSIVGVWKHRCGQ